MSTPSSRPPASSWSRGRVLSGSLPLSHRFDRAVSAPGTCRVGQIMYPLLFPDILRCLIWVPDLKEIFSSISGIKSQACMSGPALVEPFHGSNAHLTGPRDVPVNGYNKSCVSTYQKSIRGPFVDNKTIISEKSSNKRPFHPPKDNVITRE